MEHGQVTMVRGNADPYNGAMEPPPGMEGTMSKGRLYITVFAIGVTAHAVDPETDVLLWSCNIADKGNSVCIADLVGGPTKFVVDSDFLGHLFHLHMENVLSSVLRDMMEADHPLGIFEFEYPAMLLDLYDPQGYANNVSALQLPVAEDAQFISLN